MIFSDWISRWRTISPYFILFFVVSPCHISLPPHPVGYKCMYISRLYRKGRVSEGSIGAGERKWQNGGGYRTAQINIRHKAVGWLLLLPASHTQTGSVAAQKEQQGGEERITRDCEKKMVNRSRRRTRQSMACKCSEFSHRHQKILLLEIGKKDVDSFSGHKNKIEPNLSDADLIFLLLVSYWRTAHGLWRELIPFKRWDLSLLLFSGGADLSPLAIVATSYSINQLHQNPSPKK